MREEDWHQYVDGLCRLLLSSRHMWLSVPLGLAFGFIAWRQSCSLGLPDAHMAWCVVTMGGLGFTAGIGFWGVMGLVEVIQGLQKHELTLDAGHPDGFGGLRCAGSLLASWVALFYSGSLLFPYAFDVIRGKSPTADAEMVTYVMMGAFMLIGLVSFACGVARLHRIGFDFKIRADRESSARLEALMEESVHVKGQDLATVLRPLIYYHVSHQRVGEMKEYPYDARTLLELSASVLIPILVAVLDKVFR